MVRAGIKEAHPAGIWSDMTSDGPVIGTMVVVLDRAKNLPNKKKIGKQDPYAVARLAKAAQRTDTDVRGGQVPRWDKELRFPVRDSPDYKTLKISVFNDDKKTVHLIGECTIKLDKILVKGGGTDDGWRGLNCKGKYAGEILVELTFYDMRPKDEPAKPVEQRREVRKEVPMPEVPTVRGRVGGAREMGSGPRELGGTTRDRTKRRPLPGAPGERQQSPEKDDGRRTRTTRHRHSYHPDMGAMEDPERQQRRQLRQARSQYFEQEPDMRTSRSRYGNADTTGQRSRSRYFDDEEDMERQQRRQLRHSQSRMFDNAPDLRHGQSQYFGDAPPGPDMRTARSRHGYAEEPRSLRHQQSRYFDDEQQFQQPPPPPHDLRHQQSQMFNQPPDLRHSQSRMFQDEPPAPPLQQLRHQRSRTMDPAELRQGAPGFFDPGQLTPGGISPGGMAPGPGTMMAPGPGTMMMAPQAMDLGPGRPEIFDPYNDGMIPGAQPGDFNDFNAGPPPPPPAHAPPPPVHRHALPDPHAPPPPMQNSFTNGPVDAPPPPMHHMNHQLNQFQGAPAFPQDVPPQLPPHQEPQFGSFQEPPFQQQALIHPAAMHANIGQPPFLTDPMALPPDLPDAGPPPPPPPHRHTLPPDPPMQQQQPEPVIDEPNWDNHRPKSAQEEHGLPPYSASAPSPIPSGALIRRGSWIPGEAPPRAANGTPIPPALIPGVDPALADVLADHLQHQQSQQMTPYSSSPQPPILHSRTNYHRPQVEDAQDIQLYKPDPNAQNHNFYSHPPPSPPKRKPPPSPSLLHTKPERKPLPPPPALNTVPFGPDAYNILNPTVTASPTKPTTTKPLNPDHLPEHTHAPEPERKRPSRAPPPVPANHRRERFDRPQSMLDARARSPQPPPRSHRLSLPPPPDQTAVKQVSFEEPRGARMHPSRSMPALPAAGSTRGRHGGLPPSPGGAGGLVLYDPQRRGEEESRALVPRGMQPAGKMRSGPGELGREALVLSQELSLINLGAGDGGRRQRRY